MNQSKKRQLGLLFAFVLTLNSIVPLLVSSWQMQNAQQYASDDIMMICTGSEVKWISTDAYFNFDKVVFVDSPEHAPDIASQVDCTNKSLSDLQGKGALSHSEDAQLLAYHALVSSIEQRPYTAFAYLTAQTRAPPSIIV